MSSTALPPNGSSLFASSEGLPGNRWLKLRNALSLSILAFLIVTMAACGSSSSTTPPPPPVVSVSIAPTVVSVPVGQLTQFAASVANSSNQAVTWQVNGVTGGDAAHGMISTGGLYTAPAAIPNPAAVTVTAVSQANTSISASTAVTIAPTAAVSISPSAATLPAGAPLTFTANVNGVPTTAITWQVNGVTGGDATHGMITTSGVYTAPIAPPPTGAVTITAVDQGGNGSSTAPVTIGFSNATLHGPYAFSFSGRNTSGFLSAAGSFTADGKGAITGGLEDVSGQTSVSTNLTFTGTYSIGLDGRGTAVLTVNGSNAATWQIAMANDQHGLMIRFDTATVTASGSIDRQDTTAFNAAALNGNYVLNLSGINSTANLLLQVGALTSNGNGTISSGVLDVNDSGAPSSGLSVTGTYTMATTGRGTLAFTTSGGTQNFALYVVSAKQFKLVETDAGASSSVVGDLNQQAAGPFGNGSLNGGYAFTLGGSTANGPFALGGILTANGTGGFNSASSVFDENDDAVVTPSFTLLSGSYQPDLVNLGRFAATLSVNDDIGRTLQLVLYPQANGGVAIIDMDTSLVASGVAFAQAGGGFGSSNLVGGFALNWNGLLFTTPSSEEDISGQLTGSNSGIIGTLDISTLSSTVGATNPNTAVSGGVPSVGANGRGTVQLSGGGATFSHAVYLVDNNTMLVLDLDNARVLVGVMKRQF